MEKKFKISSKYRPSGDQPKAIEKLADNELVIDKLTHGITKYIVKITNFVRTL